MLPLNGVLCAKWERRTLPDGREQFRCVAGMSLHGIYGPVDMNWIDAPSKAAMALVLENQQRSIDRPPHRVVLNEYELEERAHVMREYHERKAREERDHQALLAKRAAARRQP